MDILPEIYKRLGITDAQLRANKLSAHAQPSLEELEVVDIDWEGKPFVLTRETARAWRAMVASAVGDRVELRPFSGFRSILHQTALIERHLKNQRPMDDILRHIAIPGFSEHHTGRAIDIHAPGHPVLEEDFEKTAQFAWLTKNAARFGFRLSYPRGNSHGIIYEPWHWYYAGA